MSSFPWLLLKAIKTEHLDLGPCRLGHCQVVSRAFLQNGLKVVRGEVGSHRHWRGWGAIRITGEWVFEPGRDGAPGLMLWFCYRVLEPRWARCCLYSSALLPSTGGLSAFLTLRASPECPGVLASPAPSRGTLSKSLLFPIGSDTNFVPTSHLGAASLLSSPGHPLSSHRA